MGTSLVRGDGCRDGRSADEWRGRPAGSGLKHKQSGWRRWERMETPMAAGGLFLDINMWRVVKKSFDCMKLTYGGGERGGVCTKLQD